jgi:outer membrane protein assembly factor BamE (lipoprotein component of BamABCDE complex)
MVRKTSKTSRLLSSALLSASLLTLAACGTEVRVRGNLPDPEDIAAINPGIDTRRDVAAKLGTPSALSTFESNIWYYIGSREEQGVSFTLPEELERSVLMVTLDQQGLVETTELRTLEDGQEIEVVQRETPTEGRELTLMEQIFGNVGRSLGSRTVNTGL